MQAVDSLVCFKGCWLPIGVNVHHMQRTSMMHQDVNSLVCLKGPQEQQREEGPQLSLQAPPQLGLQQHCCEELACCGKGLIVG